MLRRKPTSSANLFSAWRMVNSDPSSSERCYCGGIETEPITTRMRTAIGFSAGICRLITVVVTGMRGRVDYWFSRRADPLPVRLFGVYDTAVVG